MKSRARGLEELTRVLGARRVLGDWSARERDVVTTARTGPGDAPVARAVRRLELAAQVHVDGPTGRGSADLAVDAMSPGAPIGARIDEAIERAQVSIGPSWRSSSPGAPARVEIAERGHDDDDTVRALHERVIAEARAGGADAIEVDVALERAAVRLATSRGQVAQWDETLLRYDAVIAIGGVTARAAQLARRGDDLQPKERIAGAIALARARARAVETPAGARAVLVPAPLLGGDALALLDALAELADATLQRQGLARARVGAPIVDGADTAAEPLDLTSDGTLRWAVRSAPLGEHGEPVRRFPIVSSGTLVGLALDEREAALLGAPPNGGVRNLVIGAGASDAAALRAGGALELLEVTHVDVEPLTGRVAIGIGLATLHDDAGARTVTGRELQGDLVAAFATSRRTRDHTRTGAYSGPSLVQLTQLIVV